MDILEHTFGRDIAESWVEIQLNDLSEFSGAGEKLDRARCRELARTIITAYPYLKASELMFFFLLFKSGYYGKFYGTVDAMAVSEGLQKFQRTRREFLERYEREDEQERETRERDESAARAQAFYARLQAAGVTIEEWLKNPSMKLTPTSA